MESSITVVAQADQYWMLLCEGGSGEREKFPAWDRGRCGFGVFAVETKSQCSCPRKAEGTTKLPR